MKKILLIHGPNLNKLGKREVNHYGDLTLAKLENLIKDKARGLDYRVDCFQSNHEGELIDWLQNNNRGAVGLIVNPGALTHYSYALHDALIDTGLPCVEVHLSDINNREPWRKISVTAPACLAQIVGQKEQGYLEAIEVLVKYLNN